MHQKESTTLTKTDTQKVKGIAICLLLFHHLFRTVERLEAYSVQIPESVGADLVAAISTDCRICVWIFAFLSAYGLASKYISQKDTISSSRFIIRQWWSLMKSYWFIYTVVFVLSFFIFANPVTVYSGGIVNMVLDFLGLADLFETPMLSAVWWYMCFAQILVLFLPALVTVVERFGVCSIPLAFVFIRFWGSGFVSPYGGAYTNYLYAVLLAIMCVKFHLFERYGQRCNKFTAVLESVVLFLLFAGCAHLKVMLTNSAVASAATILSGISVIALCLLAQKYLCAPLVERILAFLGKHSGNMFMIHALIYSYYPGIVYRSHNVLVIFMTLLLTSLAASILLEFVKKVLRYEQMMSSVFEKVLAKINRANLSP